MDNRYDDPKPVFAAVIGMIEVKSDPQAELLQGIIRRELEEKSGAPEEALLKSWDERLTIMRADAERTRWRGWYND